MKSLAYIIMFVLSVGLIETDTVAQHRSSHSRPRAQVSKSGVVQDADLQAASEQKKIVEECELSDRPKPEGEIKRLSQLCGKAISMPKPAYPEEAKSKKLSGVVQVEVVIDEHGRVIWAKAVSGPDLLQGVSMKAACRARYSPTLISGRAIKTENAIQYNFVLP
jgi:TonB family C-terminal domain